MKELLKKEILLEFRNRSTLGGIMVYIIGTIFTSVLCFKGKMDKPTWNALFWIITLFTSVNISGKSFLKETGGAAIFNYMYYSPRMFIMAKVIYNMVFMLLLSLTTFLCYSFFVRNEIENMGLFIPVLILSSTGLAGALSLMSAIAAKAGGNFALMSILSFPVVLPLIIVVIKLSKQAVDGIEWAGIDGSLLLILGALNVLTITLSFLLFPYLWKE